MNKFKTILEAFEFEEPVQDDIQPQESEAPEASEEVVANAYSTSITDVTKETFGLIDQLNSIIATADSDKNCPEKENLKTLVNLAVDQATIMIGILSKAASLINPQTGELLIDGQEKADDAIKSE